MGVCLLRGCALQKRLNGSRSCLGWRLFEPRNTVIVMITSGRRGTISSVSYLYSTVWYGWRRTVELDVSVYNERRNTTDVFAYITGSVEPGQFFSQLLFVCLSDGFWRASNTIPSVRLSVRQSVCLSACHTSDPRLNGLRYYLHHTMCLRTTLWCLSLNQIVGRFGTQNELNLGKVTITSAFGCKVGYHNVPSLGLNYCTIKSSFGKVS